MKDFFTRKVPIFLIVALLVGGIWDTQKNLKYKNIAQPEHIASFSKEQALEDYDYLWTMLEENYPYFNMAKRKYDIDSAEVKNRYRAQILQKENVSFPEFYNIVNRCIGEFKGLAHLSIIQPQNYYSMLPNIETQFEDVVNSPVAFAYADLYNDKTVKTYEYMAEVEGTNKKSNQNNSPSNIQAKDINKDTAYIRIDSFYYDNFEKDQKVLNDFFSKYDSEHNIIIDITHNNGGSDYYWIDGIIAPNTTVPLRVGGKFLTMDGDICQSYMAPFSDAPNLTTDLSEVLALPNIKQEDMAQMKYLVTGGYGVEPAKNSVQRNNVYLLVNDRVYSAGDGFARFCKQTGFATLVGSTTGGEGAGGINPVFRALPNSGLLVFMRISYAINEDGTCNAEVGTIPDYFAQTGEDELAACLRVIAHNANEGASE